MDSTKLLLSSGDEIRLQGLEQFLTCWPPTNEESERTSILAVEMKFPGSFLLFLFLFLIDQLEGRVHQRFFSCGA